MNNVAWLRSEVIGDEIVESHHGSHASFRYSLDEDDVITDLVPCLHLSGNASLRFHLHSDLSWLAGCEKQSTC